jgi:hypothetical protein
MRYIIRDIKPDSKSNRPFLATERKSPSFPLFQRGRPSSPLSGFSNNGVLNSPLRKRGVRGDFSSTPVK